MSGQTYVSRASDNAGNYTAWNNGDNLGTGFNAWVFTNTGTGGQFLGSAYATSINILGQSFGVYGNPAGLNVGKTKRTFSALKENEKLTFKMSTRNTNGNKGVDILYGTDVLFNINIGGGQYSYENKSFGGVVNMDPTSDPNMAITVTLIKKSGSELNVQIDRSTGTGLAATNFTLSSATIDGIEFYVSGTNQPGDDNNLYFNSLDISQPKYTSVADGDWNTSSTWGSSIPVANSIIEINSAVTVNSAVTSNTLALTVNLNKSLTFGASGSLSVQGNWTNNGTLDMTAGGTVSFGGSSTLTLTGTNPFNNVNISCGVNFGNSSTINGTLIIQNNGSVNTNAPFYADGSTLQYDHSNFALGTEWYALFATGQGVPYNVVINGASVYYGASTSWRQVRNNLTINSGKTFSLSTSGGGDLQIGGDFTNNGTFNSNGRLVTFNGTSTQSIGGSSTTAFAYLTLSNNIAVNSNISASNTFAISLEKTITVNSSKTITLSSGVDFANSGTFTGGTGKVIFSGSSTISGTNTFYDVDISGAVDFGANSTINGTLDVKSGGYVNAGNAPIYAATSTLKYSSGGTYNRFAEWFASGGKGLPYNVQISNNTTLNLGANGGNIEARTINGNLTIDANSSLDMSVTGSVMERPLTVLGNITNSGTLKLGGINGSNAGDLVVKGNFTNNGTLTHNSRLVTFNGSTPQTIGGSSTATFGYLLFDNDVSLTNNISAANRFVINPTRTLNARTRTITLSSGVNFANSGTFTAGTGKVVFLGASTITGTNTFYDVELNGVVDFGASSTVNNILSFKAGSSVTGTLKYHATSSTLNYSGITVSTGSEFPATDGPANITLTNNAIVTFGTARTIPGNVTVANGSSLAVTNTLVFNNFELSGSANFGTASTLNGTLAINTGGFVSVNAPTYGASSTLKYNSGVIYGRSLEWSSTSGAGYPNDVQISNGTTLNLGNSGTTTARQMAGNLTIDAGSALDMSVSGSVMERPLTVFGNITNGGTLKLGGINDPDAGDLIVKGNFTNNGTFNSNTREVVFDGTSVQTISGTTSPVFTYFALSNPAGVELGVNTTIQNRLRFDEGVLRLTNFNLSLSSGATYSGTPSAIQMIVTNGTGMLKFTGTGPSTLLFPIGDETGTAEYSPAQVILNSGTETIGVKVVDGAHPSKGPGALYLTRYWDITRDGNSSINYDLTLNYLDGDVSEPAQESSLVMGKFNGTLWTVLPTTLDATANTLTVSSQTSFSQFTGGEPSALPVELSSFNAKVSAGTVLLDWETKTEMNNYGFEVERKLVNSDWTKVGFVEGYGMSNSPKFYSYKDRPSGTGKISYRLKQIDNDGQFEYSPVVEVLVDNIPNGFVLEQNYPNPFNPETAIRFALKEDTKATLKVYNSLGAEVATLFDGTAEAGRYYDLKFGGNELASGFYIYKLVAGDYVSVKKMLLMK